MLNDGEHGAWLRKDHATNLAVGDRDIVPLKDPFENVPVRFTLIRVCALVERAQLDVALVVPGENLSDEIATRKVPRCGDSP